jgi:hypothetical protein
MHALASIPFDLWSLRTIGELAGSFVVLLLLILLLPSMWADSAFLRRLRAFRMLFQDLEKPGVNPMSSAQAVLDAGYFAFDAMLASPASKMPPIVDDAFASSAPFALKLLIHMTSEPLPFGLTDSVAL